uniref:Uncharacterized protein n=1 Tax=Meloidogyne enterolobii TaxID=390850 RepID=A0A6V7VXG6_MELEN|nr:unnamed protein product [Meloidogyne enterolobii]
MDNSQNTQINSTNNLIEPPKGIESEIESSTVLEDEDVEWIEVTDDEGCGEQEKEQNVGQLQKQPELILQQKPFETFQTTSTTSIIPTNNVQSESTEKITERLPDELSSISPVESDEQSEELTIPTTKDLLTGAAQKVAFSVEKEEKENENKNGDEIQIKIFEGEKKEEIEEEKELKTPTNIQSNFFPTEKGKEEEDKNRKENIFEIPTIYFPKNETLINQNEEGEKIKAAEKEAERLITEIGLKENEENKRGINEGENKNLDNLEGISTEIKIQPFSYSKEADSSNKEENKLIQGDQEKDEKEDKIDRKESKSEETKFYEVPPNGYETLELTEVKPANVNYLIPQESKEEKMLTETIILPKNVRFVEERKEEQQKIVENKSKDEISSLDEYELKLRRRSKEALELVDKICGLQAQETEKKPPITRPSQFNLEMDRPVNTTKDELKEALNAGIHGLSGSNRGTVGVDTKIPESVIQIGGGPILDVECVSVSQSLLQFPMDCLLLPGNNLLIVDSDAGLLLISLESKQVLKQISPKQNVWRNPECCCLGSGGNNNGEEQTIFVLLEYNVNIDKENSDIPPTSPIKGILKERQSNEKPLEQQQQPQSKPEWRRYICRFSISDFSMLDRIEAPKWLRERVIWSCKMCSFNKFIYLAANTPNQGFLFELNCENGKWIECRGTRINSQFADVNYFASVGPVTELLLVETNRCYVQLISIYNSTVVNARILGICERPGALCVDNYGNVLIFDRSSSSVGLYSRAFLEKIGDLAFVERANCQLSARDGVIAILCKTTKELRLHKYLDKLNLINKQLFGENYFCGDGGKKKKNGKGRIEEIGEEEEDEIIREPIPLMRA